MPFNKPLPEWNKTATKPAQFKLDEGWQVEEKPPASIFNWLQNTTFAALQELQQYAIHNEQKGVADGLAALDANGKVNHADGSDPEQNAIKWAKGFGLGATAKSLTQPDLNVITDNGFYYCNGPTNAPDNGGSASHGFLIHITIGDYSLQIYSVYSNNSIYVRRQINGVWQSWKEQETTSGAQSKAIAAETNSKNYADNNFLPFDGSGEMAGPLTFNNNVKMETFLFSQPESLDRNRFKITMNDRQAVKYRIDWAARNSGGAGQQNGGVMEITIQQRGGTTEIKHYKIEGDYKYTNIGRPYIINNEVVIPFRTANNGTTTTFYVYAMITMVGNGNMPTIIDEATISTFPEYGFDFNGSPMFYGDANGNGSVEYGSNSNGEYVRYPNGVQICWIDEGSLTYISDTSLEFQWSFPASFNSAPSVSVTDKIVYQAGVLSHLRGNTNIGSPRLDEYSDRCDVYLTSNTTIDQNKFNNYPQYFAVAAFAIGRWK